MQEPKTATSNHFKWFKSLKKSPKAFMNSCYRQRSPDLIRKRRPWGGWAERMVTCGTELGSGGHVVGDSGRWSLGEEILRYHQASSWIRWAVGARRISVIAVVHPGGDKCFAAGVKVGQGRLVRKKCLDQKRWWCLKDDWTEMMTMAIYTITAMFRPWQQGALNQSIRSCLCSGKPVSS